MNVGIVYRPPNSNFNDFLTELRSIIKTLPKTVTYLMGDFIKMTFIKMNQAQILQHLNNFLCQKGYFQSFH